MKQLFLPRGRDFQEIYVSDQFQSRELFGAVICNAISFKSATGFKEI